MPRKAKPDDLASLVRKHLRALELGKKHYKRADAILEQLTKETEPDVPIVLAEGKTAYLRDQYKTKLTVFKPVGVRRYEVEVINA